MEKSLDECYIKNLTEERLDKWLKPFGLHTAHDWSPRKNSSSDDIMWHNDLPFKQDPFNGEWILVLHLLPLSESKDIENNYNLIFLTDYNVGFNRYRHDCSTKVLKDLDPVPSGNLPNQIIALQESYIAMMMDINGKQYVDDYCLGLTQKTPPDQIHNN